MEDRAEQLPALRRRVSEIDWYHTLELAPGVVTSGWFDLRPHVHRFGLPERLDGMRVLDVGTWDGFWAFEMERRGAAEVVAIDVDDLQDLDWPPRRRPQQLADVSPRGAGFRLAREALESRVTRVPCNVYDANPGELGTFDLVFCGMVLIHLRDQLLALERIAALCSGTFIMAEAVERLIGCVPFSALRYRAYRDASVVFWAPNKRAWRRMLWTAGFERIREQASFRVDSNRGFSVRQVVFHASDSLFADVEQSPSAS